MGAFAREEKGRFQRGSPYFGNPPSDCLRHRLRWLLQNLQETYNAVFRAYWQFGSHFCRDVSRALPQFHRKAARKSDRTAFRDSVQATKLVSYSMDVHEAFLRSQSRARKLMGQRGFASVVFPFKWWRLTSR